MSKKKLFNRTDIVASTMLSVPSLALGGQLLQDEDIQGVLWGGPRGKEPKHPANHT